MENDDTDFSERLRDYDGVLRMESDAYGPILTMYQDPTGKVRVRRQAMTTAMRHEIVIEWWDGQRWLYMYGTHEISNDYAATDLRNHFATISHRAAMHAYADGSKPPPKE